MSDETYYTVLNVKESASASEIKTAYRDLIKQVHPDTIANLAPYLRKIAEDKAKEINEAYAVLSNVSKRTDYDRLLAEYRRQIAPRKPPTSQPTPPTSTKQPSSQAASTSFGYCNKCGTSLYASGFCPKCNKSAAAAAQPQPKAVRGLGYAWARLIQLSNEHTYIVVFSVLAALFYITWIAADTTSQSATSQADSKSPVFTNKATAASKGHYSQYPCDSRDKVSPIDEKPCSDQWVPAPPPGITGDEKSTEVTPQAPITSASGVYVGTVRNQTANLSSAFTIVIHQTKAGLLDGCMEVQPPLYGSGTLRGRVRGSHIDFIVEDMTFQGDASKSAIAGSYVVSRQDGQQLGDFRMTKQPATEVLYTCVNGTLVDVAKDTSPLPK